MRRCAGVRRTAYGPVTRPSQSAPQGDRGLGDRGLGDRGLGAADRVQATVARPTVTWTGSSAGVSPAATMPSIAASVPTR